MAKGNTTDTKSKSWYGKSVTSIADNKGWRLVGKPQTVKITRKLATEYALMQPAPGDRPLSERRNDLYKAFIKAKQFRSPEWAEAYCKETGLTYRVNGKHTSGVMSGWNTDEDGPYPDLYATIAKYECDTLGDVAELYATFDSKHTTRSTTDINWMFASAVPELATISKWTIDRIVSGINFHPTKSTYAEKTAAQRAEVLLTETEFCVWMHEKLLESATAEGTAKRKMLMRSSVANAIYLTYKVNKADALEFWLAVRDETDPTPDMVTRKLARYLRTATLYRMRVTTAREAKPVADIREMGAKCITAWNAWRKGDSSDLKYYPSAAYPTPK